MKAVWDRIHTWLAANAPAGYGNLRAGTSDQAIRDAERAMGLILPDDVKASYRIHDGQDVEPGLVGGEGWMLMPLREAVKKWGDWSRANPKDAGCVPIAWGVMGDHVFLDLDPASEEPGRLMIQRRDTAQPAPLMPSFAAWLEEFAEKLEAGEFVYSEEHEQVMYADELDID
jgi:cell wall assembly regulator SMI1